MDPRADDLLDELAPGGAGDPEDGAPDQPGAAIRWSWEAASGQGVPREPAAAEGVTAAADPAAVLEELLAFHRHGRRPADAHDVAGPAPLPALLHPYRDLSRIRHDYPLCRDGAGGEGAMQPLGEIVDGVLAEIAAPGDTGEQRRRHVRRVESIVRSLAAEFEGERLDVLWDRAAARLLETSQLSGDKREILRESVTMARRALAADGTVVSCGPHTPERLLCSAMGAFWTERCAAWRDDLELLIGRLRDILNADFSQSAAARSPQRLGEALGAAGDEVDLAALSAVLASHPHESALPERRRERLAALVAALEQMQPLFTGAPSQAVPFRVDAVCESIAAALAEHESRMRRMTEFFKSVRVARLEARHRYRDDVHDPPFARFDRSHLTPEELALCPPVLLRLAGDAGGGDEIERLLSLLSTTLPVKVLVVLSSLHRSDGAGGGPRAAIAWPARLAGMAAMLQHAYVLQAPVSRAALLQAGLLQGLRCPGPALFCVYAPAADAERGLPTYLTAAAAAESRVLPILVFDPSKGTTLAERADLAENPSSDRDWHAERFSYRRADGEEASREMAFTPADFLFCVHRGEGDFWTVAPERWHESMTPIDEYLEMPAERAAGRIPYLSTVDADGRLARTVVSRAVVEASRQCRSFWRGLQEWGGIHNSFAARLLGAERERLAREKDREVEAIERNYQAQLDRDLGDLTKEIVQRIASRLLGMEGAALSAPAASLPAAAAPSAAAAPPQAPAALFDEPYIDTPLCTSCNECTQLNPRMFGYDANKQAEIRDAAAGPFSDLVRAAELCPVHIIHPGKPRNASEPGVEDWVKRAERFR